jgi:hypothetical protein
MVGDLEYELEDELEHELETEEELTLNLEMETRADQIPSSSQQGRKSGNGRRSPARHPGVKP